MSIPPLGTMVETLVYTKPEEFEWRKLTMPYESITGLYIPDNHLGRAVGDSTSPSEAQRVVLPIDVAHRLAEIIQELEGGVAMDCHGFARSLTGVPSYESAPFAMVQHLPEVIELPVGASGVITSVSPAGRQSVPHSIGYGLGDGRSLQVLSHRGELGFAADIDVVDFHRENNLGQTIALHSYGS